MRQAGAEIPFALRLEIAHQMIANARVGLTQHVYDQVEAAARDTQRLARETAQLVRLVQPDRGWYERMQLSMTAEQQAYVWAGVLDCMRATCVHLRREGPQVAIAQLPLRRSVCRRCLAIVRRPPAEDDDRCDLCGEHGVVWFTPFQMNSGPLIVSGDLCPSCARVLGLEEHAA